MKYKAPFAILLLSLITILVSCGGPSATQQALSYDTSAATLLIQVSRVGGSIKPGPLYTLQGDGKVTYVDQTSSECMRGTLSADQTHAIMQTVVISDHFFNFEDGKTYGKVTSPDVALLQIVVNANKSQRTVKVASANDADSQALSDIVDYLGQVAPAQPQVCS